MIHKELAQKRQDFSFGTVVTNCVVHMAFSLLNRPSDCHLCQTDVRNQLSRAIRVNKFLNDLLDQWEALEPPR